MPEKLRGTVATWLNRKGIGFITPEGKNPKEGHDVLVHFSQIQQNSDDDFKSLDEGSIVLYELETDPQNEEKTYAVRVTGEDGEDCKPRQKGKGKGKKGKGKGKKGKGKKGKGKGKREDGEEGEGEGEAEEGGEAEE